MFIIFYLKIGKNLLGRKFNLKKLFIIRNCIFKIIFF